MSGFQVIKALQAWLQVLLVIQFHLGSVLEALLVVQADATRLVLSFHQDGELWMAGVEALNLPLKWGRDSLRLEIGVAAGAVPIAHERQNDMPLVLDMATGARRGERLGGVMDGAVVALQATDVRHPQPESLCLLWGRTRRRLYGEMALTALHAEHGMGR